MKKKLHQIFEILCLISFFFMFQLLSAQASLHDNSQNSSAENKAPLFITAAVRTDYFPVSFLENDKPAGFDVDVLMHAAERANLSVSVEMLDILDMLTSIPSRSIDAAAGMIITPERRGYLDFTVPYYTDRYVLVSARSRGILGLGELSGKKIAYYPEDFAVDTFVAFFNYKMEMQIALSVKDAVLLVNRGEADYTIIPYSYGSAIIRSLGLEDQLVIGRDIIPAEYRFAVSKNNTELLFILNDAILQMRSDGTLESLARRWKMAERERLDPYWYFVIACAAVSAVLIFSVILIMRKKIEEIQKNALQQCRSFSGVLDAVPYPLVWKDLSYTEIGSNEKYKIMMNTSPLSGHDVHEQKYTFIGDNGAVWTLFVYLDAHNETILRNENSRLSAQITAHEIHIKELSLTDSTTGLFNANFMSEKIDEEIRIFDKTGKKFTVVSLLLQQPILTRTEIASAVEILKENVGSASFCAYAGSGVFILLFPQKRKDTVEIFISGTVEIIERDTSVRGVSFTAAEYAGQGRSQLAAQLGIEGLLP